MHLMWYFEPIPFPVVKYGISWLFTGNQLFGVLRTTCIGSTNADIRKAVYSKNSKKIQDLK